MEKRKLRVGFCFFPYGGNGGISSEVPTVRNWIISTVLAAKADDRIHDIVHQDFSDTPITMTRNRAVVWGRENKVDVLVMVDSDMAPDMYVGHDPAAKPFFQSSFDFIYDRWDKGPHVVVAPYCGPPPHPLHGGESNVYVFHWTNSAPHTDPDGIDFALKGYTRSEAAVMTGIQECGAGPTGLVMYDMRAFDLIDPAKTVPALQQRGLNRREINALVTSFFDYEWTDIYHSQKASTEDVVNLRDISLIGMQTLGYNPLYCNWDSWAGHWKPMLVGKPTPLRVDQINQKYRLAVQENVRSDEKMRVLPMEQPASKPKVVEASRQAEPQKPTLHPDAQARQAQYMAATEPKQSEGQFGAPKSKTEEVVELFGPGFDENGNRITRRYTVQRNVGSVEQAGPFNHMTDGPVIPRGYGIPVSP